MTDAEIFNFFLIYLLFEPAENNYKVIFCSMIEYHWMKFAGWDHYLQGEGDWNYWWLVENLGEGLHQP